jgi:hypothetical protein
MFNKSLKSLFFMSFVCFNLFSEMDLRAFHGIEKLINKDYHYLNPLWGQVAKDNDIIYNLRFYAYDKMIESKGLRNYINDSSKDPTWNLIKTLFPSPAGSLATTTNNTYNIGNYVSTETVAILLDIAQHARLNRNNENYLSEINNSLYESLDQDKLTSQFEEDKKSTAEEHEKNMRNQLEKLSKFIINSVKNETGENKFYHKYFTETTILCFFVVKFNTQTDIFNLLRHLNKIFKKSYGVHVADNIPEKEDLLTENSIKNYQIKQDLNYEEIFNLTCAYMFYSPFPYRAGKEPLQNETISSYRRQENKNGGEERFSDCAETALRHVLNLLLFDANKRIFDLSPFENIKSPFINELKNFYLVQDAKKANDGSLNIRQAFNQVVADMNFDKKERHIVYARANIQNEVNPGFINFIHILQKIFNIEFEEKVPKEKSKWVDWVKSVLSKLFAKINAKAKFEFNYNIKQEGNDIYGTVKVNINNLFSFDIYQSIMHAKIYNIKALTLTDDTSIKEKIKSAKFNDDYQQGLALLVSNKVSIEPYQTFYMSLSDNQTRLEWLKDYSSKKDINKKYLANVLAAMSWHDEEIVKEINKYIMAVNKTTAPKISNSFLFDNIAGLYVNKELLEYFDKNGIQIKNFKNLKYIFVYLNSNERKILDISGLKKLKKLNLDCPDLENLSLKNNDDLEEAYLDAPNLKQLDVSDLKKLKKLDLKGSGIENLSLKNNDDLEDLYLNFSKLKQLDVSDLKKLKRLNLNHSGIENLSLNDGLEKLHLYNCRKLKQLDVSGLKKLKKLNLNHSGIENLSLKNNDDLEKLDLSNCSELTQLDVSGLKKLKKLDLSDSSIMNLSLKNNDGLEELSLPRKLKIPDVSDLKNLKMLDLTGSYIENLSLKNSPALEYLVLRNCQKLKNLEVSGLENLKKLNLWDSYIENLSLKDNDALERINLTDHSKVKQFEVSDLKNLKKLDLSKSSIEILSLKNSPALEELNLPNQLRYLELSGLEKFKKLNLSKSSIVNLSLKNNPALEELDLPNQLRQLELSDLEKLKKLHLRNSSIEILSLKNNPALEELNLPNQLRYLELSGLEKFKKLNLSKSSIVNLSLKNNPALEELDLPNLINSSIENLSLIGNTNLTQIDLHKFINLKSIYLEDLNNLRDISFNNLNSLTSIAFNNIKSAEKLYLSYLNKIKTISLINMQNLEDINLEQMPELISIDLKEIPKLDTVNLKNIPKLKLIHIGKNINKKYNLLIKGNVGNFKKSGF